MHLGSYPRLRKRAVNELARAIMRRQQHERLAKLFADCGHKVILGSRTPERAAQIAQGLGAAAIRGGSYELAADAPVVLPSMFLRDGMLDTLEPLRARLDGKLLIDITNPFNNRYDDFILPWNTSGAEEIRKRFPRDRLKELIARPGAT